MDNESIEYWKVVWESFKKGSVSSFKLIYLEYIDLLYAYGSKITSDEEVLKDSVQQLFLELYTSGKNLSNPGNLKFYLLKALKIIIIHEIKKRYKYTSFELVDSIKFELELDVESEVIAAEEKSAKMRFLQKTLSDLPPEKRELLFLKFYSGFNNEEIGGVLGLKAETVKKRIYRILKQLHIQFRDLSIIFFSLCSKI